MLDRGLPDTPGPSVLCARVTASCLLCLAVPAGGKFRTQNGPGGKNSTQNAERSTGGALPAGEARSGGGGGR